MIFFSSDSHFWHTNVIRYCDRPFSSVEQMNEILIHRWNSMVGPEDVVYYLGDFSLAIRAVETITPRLNGTKYLIPGNHDFCHSVHSKSNTPDKQLRWLSHYRDCGWEVLGERAQLVYQDQVYLLCHMPFFGLTKDERYEKHRPVDEGQFLIHGHVHEKAGKRGNAINIGVDVWDGYPAPIDQVIEILRSDVEIPPPKWGRTLYDVYLGYI